MVKKQSKALLPIFGINNVGMQDFSAEKNSDINCHEDGQFIIDPFIEKHNLYPIWIDPAIKKLWFKI